MFAPIVTEAAPPPHTCSMPTSKSDDVYGSAIEVVLGGAILRIRAAALGRQPIRSIWNWKSVVAPSSRHKSMITPVSMGRREEYWVEV
jgi:hypothetical protein